jgi:HSP20 family molecular chaperone IbpA
MSRMSPFSSPLLLGFDEIERLLDRASRVPGDSYPPYNIERLPAAEGKAARILITIAVAGFREADLDITVEDNELTIRGRQGEDGEEREYLHRGIAARQFQRSFVLANGMEVAGAELKDGLLTVTLVQPEPEKTVRKIKIGS